MVDLTAREMAWLRSIEPPLPVAAGAGPPLQRSTKACLRSARAALSQSRLLLETLDAHGPLPPRDVPPGS